MNPASYDSPAQRSTIFSHAATHGDHSPSNSASTIRATSSHVRFTPKSPLSRSTLSTSYTYRREMSSPPSPKIERRLTPLAEDAPPPGAPKMRPVSLPDVDSQDNSGTTESGSLPSQGLGAALLRNALRLQGVESYDADVKRVLRTQEYQALVECKCAFDSGIEQRSSHCAVN